MSQIIGVVGGLGPKAGENLHAKILANTRAVRDSDHLQILLYTNPTVPDRGEFIFGEGPENPAVKILQSLRTLWQAGAKVLCVPCNTAHAPAIWNEVEAGFAAAVEAGQTDAQLLHIVRLTVQFIVRNYPSASHVGVLGTNGTLNTRVYADELLANNIRPLHPTESGQRQVQEAIYHPDWGIKAQSDPVTKEAVDALKAAALRMIADGAEAIILGCTEIPLAIKDPDIKGIPVVNSNTVLAREAIRRAAGEAKLTRQPQ